jgi:hypothetical protein
VKATALSQIGGALASRDKGWIDAVISSLEEKDEAETN